MVNPPKFIQKHPNSSNIIQHIIIVVVDAPIGDFFAATRDMPGSNKLPSMCFLTGYHRFSCVDDPFKTDSSIRVSDQMPLDCPGLYTRRVPVSYPAASRNMLPGIERPGEAYEA